MDSPARSGAYAASLRDTNSVKSQAVVTVTVDDKQIWHWDGGYLLGVAK